MLEEFYLNLEYIVKGWFYAAKGTGRTMKALAALNTTKEIYVVHSENFKRYCERIIQANSYLSGRKFTIIVANPENLNSVYDKTRGLSGKLVFDHYFLERTFMSALSERKKELSHLQNIYNEVEVTEIDFRRRG